MSISKKVKQSLTEHIEKIEVPEELDESVRQSFIRYHKKKETFSMKKRVLTICLAAAILLPTGVYATLNGASYFTGNHDLNGLVNDGVKRAVSEGLSVPMDQKMTDQGISIHFKEVYVEDTKVLIHYSIEQLDGTLVPFEFDTTGLEVLNEGTKDGKQVENPTYQEQGLEGHSVLPFIGTSKEDRLPFYLTDAAGKEINTGIADHDQPEGILAFVTDGRKLPQSITLNVDVNRIGKTKGSWKGQVVIDQSKARQATEAAN
ncbi:DUF4179 domain-containing protein [Brevibacillus sp. NRS-1366]|uniref:DUF4179 domain-containing protein n=1 Tax=Brevibacillus sp. NRS-1366 TaxID=3233899 RepID=UPI003D1BCFB3